MFIIGLNYWSKKGGPLMWREFDRQVIQKELQQISSLGVNVVRAFTFWPDFQDSPGTVNEGSMEELRDFLDIAQAAGVKVYLTFIVGHMSGENWDPAWKDRSFFELEHETDFYISTLVKRFKNHPAVGGWILSNELPIYATDKKEVVTKWIRNTVTLIKSIDRSHPVSTGDGYWGIIAPSSFDPFEYADLVDYHGPHTYTPDSDAYRQTVFPQFVLKASKINNKPVILEEFGASSVLGSDEHIAGYYRALLSGSLAAGASGAWGWCYSDFDLKNQRPYSHHPHELEYGVTTVDWKVKPQGLELQKFSQFLRDFGDAAPIEDDVGLLIPSYVHEQYPFTSQHEAYAISSSLLSAFCMLLQNRINPRVMHEQTLSKQVIDESQASYGWPKLLILPYAIRYTAKTQEALRNFVEEGGSVMLSYGFNSWFNFRSLGIEHDLFFNHPARLESVSVEVDGGSVRLSAAEAFHDQWNYDASIAPVKGGDVLLYSGGLPILVKNQLGKGRVYFITFPFERWVAASPWPFESSDPHLIYKRVLGLEGFKDRHEGWSKWIQAVRFSNGKELVINHSWEKTAAGGMELIPKGYAAINP
ncbi:DUF4434 domain-containing protein [Tardisphaera saccharovorans]